VCQPIADVPEDALRHANAWQGENGRTGRAVGFIDTTAQRVAIDSNDVDAVDRRVLVQTCSYRGIGLVFPHEVEVRKK
jgi:hypothetical protein